MDSRARQGGGRQAGSPVSHVLLVCGPSVGWPLIPSQPSGRCVSVFHRQNAVIFGCCEFQVSHRVPNSGVTLLYPPFSCLDSSNLIILPSPASYALLFFLLPFLRFLLLIAGNPLQEGSPDKRGGASCQTLGVDVLFGKMSVNRLRGGDSARVPVHKGVFLCLCTSQCVNVRRREKGKRRRREGRGEEWLLGALGWLVLLLLGHCLGLNHRP